MMLLLVILAWILVKLEAGWFMWLLWGMCLAGTLMSISERRR